MRYFISRNFIYPLNNYHEYVVLLLFYFLLRIRYIEASTILVTQSDS